MEKCAYFERNRYCLVCNTGHTENECIFAGYPANGMETCHFYKTKSEKEASLQAVADRLNSLPDYKQDEIAEKYYGGRRGWNKR